jgi:hypothetical protein
MQAVAGPRIVEAEGLVHDEGLSHAPGAREGRIEGVVALEAAEHLHPVEDVVAGAGGAARRHHAEPRGIGQLPAAAAAL